MKCYKHPKVVAVGVCSQCGKGVCDKCAVEIGGKLYCKSDADKVFGATKTKTAPAAPTTPSKESQKSVSEERKKILGQSSLAWTSCILGFFFFPPIFWGLSLILSYIALSRATDVGLSQRDVIVCAIPSLVSLVMLVWWGIGIIDLL